MEGARGAQSEAIIQIKIKNKKAATNFDTEFTKEDPVLTPVNPDIVKTINQVRIEFFYCTHRIGN